MSSPCLPHSPLEESLPTMVHGTAAAAFGWRFVDPDAIAVSNGTLRRVPLSLALTKRCVPLVVTKRRCVVLVDDPLNGIFIEANPQLFGPPYEREIEIVLTTARHVDALLEKRRSNVRT